MDFFHLKSSFYEALFHYASNSLLMALSFVGAVILFLAVPASYKEKAKVISLISVTAVVAFLGARILHVFVEHRELLKTPELIFTRFDGMTFNGSLLFGIPVFFFGMKSFAESQRHKYWDQAALITSLSYGLMRLGCFSAGCCWGKVSAVPWSVKYTHSQFMPWAGIPVHPVQLYDSALGFLIFAALIFWRKKQPRIEGHLFQLFLVMYSVGRFFTEFFRGDAFRGEGLWLGLSTSQLVSIGLISGMVLWTLYKNLSSRTKRKLLFAALALMTTACLPQAPKENLFQSVQRTENFEIYQTRKSSGLPVKNILFVAADDNIQWGFSQLLQSAYKTENVPRLEDIVFWEYIDDLKRNYNVIVRIPPKKVSYASFSSGLQYMESLNQPYDLILLTHGMPNHLSTGTGYFFSYKELDALKGKLSHLNLVLLQSCFGESLVPDFKEAGAKYVMSYPGFNRNFFFYGFFLKYEEPLSTAATAYQLAQSNFAFNMGLSPYWQITNIFVNVQNQQLKNAGTPTISVSSFIKSMPLPVLE